MSHNAILAVISLLAEKWPSCFSIIESGRRPLKLGIRDDVLAALDGAISAGKVSAALRCTYPRLNISIGFCRELGASISMAGPLALFPKKTKHMLGRNLPRSRRSGQSVPRLHQILRPR
jgi:hypothetical protein